MCTEGGRGRTIQLRRITDILALDPLSWSSGSHCGVVF